MRAGVREILPLQPDLRAPTLREPPCKGQRGGSARPGAQFAAELVLERLTVQVLAHAALEAVQRRDQSLRHITAAERAESPVGVGKFTGDGIGQQALRVECSHVMFSCAAASRPRAAA